MRTLLLFDKKVDIDIKIFENETFNACESIDTQEKHTNVKYSHCVLFLSYDVGVNKRQIDIILKNISIPHWLIVFVKDPAERHHTTKPLQRRVIAEIDNANITLDFEDYSCLEDSDRIYDYLDMNIDDADFKALFVTTKEIPHDDDLKMALENNIEKYNLFFMTKKEFKESDVNTKIYQKIIFVGYDLDDFNIESLESGQKRAHFLLDRTERTPSYFFNASKIKSAIMQQIKKNGWELPYSQKDLIFIGSSKFFNVKKEGDLNKGEIVLFDQYGLPLCQGDYNENSLNKLNQMNEFFKLVDYLEN